jgi:hypothetical protein
VSEEQKKNTRDTLFTVFYLLLGLAGAIAAGILSYGPQRLFHMPAAMLSFVMVGLAGALFYTAVRLRGAGLVVLIMVLFYAAQLTRVGPLRGPHVVSRLIAAGIYAIPVGIALIIAAYLFKKLARIRFGKFILMGVLVAVGYVLMLVLWLLRNHAPVQLGILGTQAWMGLKVGGLIGVGLEVVDLFAGVAGPREVDIYKPPA